MKSKIGVKSLKWAFWIDQFQGKPSPRNALIFASPNRRRLASRSICLPKSLEQAMLASTVRTSRLGRQSVAEVGCSASFLESVSRTELADGSGVVAATDSVWVSASLATCLGSQKHVGGSGCGSLSETVGKARIRQAFFVSFQPL